MRAIFRAKDAHEAQGLHDSWLKATAYCRIAPVVAAEKKVRRRRADVIAAVESINQKIKVTIASKYGLRNTDNLIALIMLRCSNLQPAMPWEGRAEEARKVEARRKRNRGHAASAA